MKKTALLVFCFSILFSAAQEPQKGPKKYVNIFNALISLTRIIDPSEFEQKLRTSPGGEVLLKYVPDENVFDFAVLMDTVRYEAMYRVGCEEFQILASKPDASRKLYFTRMFYINGQQDDNVGFGRIKGSDDPKWRLDVFLYETFGRLNPVNR